MNIYTKTYKHYSIDDNGDKWIANFGKSVCLGNEYDTTDWKQSAIDRE